MVVEHGQISRYSGIVSEIQKRRVLHDYGEPMDAEISCYSLVEIVLEKMRGLLQYKAKLQNKGWAQSRARDYYDLWRLLKEYPNQIQSDRLAELFAKKCAVRQVSFAGPEEFFDPQLLAHARESWETGLVHLVPGTLPDFSGVVEDLRSKLSRLVQT
ncbi:MAG: nucleotidyl transferase AbiEii/AbiGii toxin family protein [Elusimicrobia bacterium]|nr:nucleotidyl transferase AbiEii/AbiGii toxin family protein [Elusimicrobiota bacterium]